MTDAPDEVCAACRGLGCTCPGFCEHGGDSHPDHTCPACGGTGVKVKPVAAPEELVDAVMVGLFGPRSLLDGWHGPDQALRRREIAAVLEVPEIADALAARERLRAIEAVVAERIPVGRRGELALSAKYRRIAALVGGEV